MRKIIKAVFICLLVTFSTVPPAIATDPILEAFDSSWRVTSLYGPRYLKPGTKGTNPHRGVDFARGGEGESMGYMIKSRSAGVIADFGFISSKGWNLVIKPTDGTKNSHGIKNIVYYHLFRNDGTVPEIKDSAFKKVKVVKVAKKQNNPNFVGPPEYCDAIAFWIDDTTLVKVLTRSACKGGIYENHQNVPAESKVEAEDEIAPVGNSSTAQIGPHLHLTINDPVKRNPFYVVKPSSTSGSDSATFFKDLNDTNKLVSDKGLWFDIKTGKSLSLNSVSLLLKLANGTNIPLENIFNFGGAPNEKAINPNVTTTISNTYCINAPSGSYASPTNIGCDWDGTPNTKTWRFFYPYDIASLPSGTHQICLTAKDVSANSILSDVCTSFIPSSSCDNPKIGDKCHGGIVFYVDGTGQHGLVAAMFDQGSYQWEPRPNLPNNPWPFLGATADGVGAGASNTTLITALIGAGSYAAMVARSYNGGGYNDWYLPSKYELNLLYGQKSVVGNFAAYAYWSSTEYDFNGAWAQGFINGIQFGLNGKYNTYHVRAVRAF